MNRRVISVKQLTSTALSFCWS